MLLFTQFIFEFNSFTVDNNFMCAHKREKKSVILINNDTKHVFCRMQFAIFRKSTIIVMQQLDFVHMLIVL